MADEPHRSIALAVTGASGALYAVRTLAELLVAGRSRRAGRVRLRPPSPARRTRRGGVGRAADAVSVGEVRPAGRARARSPSTATAISGRRSPAAVTDARPWSIVPCSMKTLAGIAHGLSRNLVERAADVMLKEQRPLVIVPRETPMSLPALRNMVLCAEAGAMVLPAMPAFYQLPEDARRSRRLHGREDPQRRSASSTSCTRPGPARSGPERSLQEPCCQSAATVSHEDTKTRRTMLVQEFLRVLRAFVANRPVDLATSAGQREL